jgi:RNA polymerase sigma factor (sigma-70 family)
MQNDEQLFANYVATRNQAALVELMGRHYEPLTRYLRRYFGDGPSTDDVMQQAWLNVWEERDEFEPGSRFAGWLFTIIRNCAFDELRRQGRHKAVSQGDTVEPVADTLTAQAIATDKELVDKAWEFAEVRFTADECEILRDYFASVARDVTAKRFALKVGTLNVKICRLLAILKHECNRN